MREFRQRRALARPPPSLDVVPNNLPVKLTTFVGRERELADLGEALARGRLLTLTGAGGCGKTRLALQAAADALERFPDGSWWVELAAVSDPELVGAALAEAIGVRQLPGATAFEAALSHLAPKRALVLLDNCEHLLERSAAVVSALLEGCPEVTVVTTSREPLGVPGETTWRVPSLSLPAEREPEAVDALGQSDAVRLFIERAREVRPNFAVTNETASTVAQICHELDGIPLAIELAAARVRMLTPGEIEAGLADRFRLLTGGGRSALPRQQTLRASVDWSHELLAEAERILLRRLSVFVGGFSLDVMEEVCAGDGLERLELFDLLTSLVDKSLVAIDEDGASTRFRLLETTRQYELERLADAGEVELARDRHRDAFVALAERLEPELTGAGQPDALELLDAEAANLYRAIEWAAATDGEATLRLCAALTFWWVGRGLFTAGESSFQRALAAAGEEPSPLRARLLWGRGNLLAYAGAYEEAVASASAALELAEGLGEHGTAGRALDVLGLIQQAVDPRGSLETLERSRRLARAAGDAWCEADATQVLAYAHLIGLEEREAGLRELDAALEIVERIGYRPFVAYHHLGYAWTHYSRGEHERCRELLERAVAASREVGEPVSEGLAVGLLANTDVDRGGAEGALELAEACLERMVAAGAGLAIPLVNHGIGYSKLALGHLDDARATMAEIAETPGFVVGTAMALASLAEIERLRGDLDAAAERADAALATAEQVGNPWLAARARHAGGRLAAARGEWDVAERLVNQALDARADGGFLLDLPDSLEGLAEVAAGMESAAEAARLLAAAQRARRDLGFVRVLPEQGHWDRLAAGLRKALGDEAFAAAWAEGESLGWEQAVAWARRARGSRKRPSGGWASLTPTELEVARHAAEGLTNPQIGERLFISRGTVKVHLSHIYAKLGIRNRAELAAEFSRREAATDAPTN